MRGRREHPAKVTGQIAPVALFGILIAGGVLAMMFNTGQKITEKSQLANAADAAAYSGAVWTARHLNFMAYTNRAMIANHAAAGHFISYVSWIRYVNDSIDFIDRITQFIPYVGQYVDLVQMVAAEVRDVTETAARLAIPAIDGWNANFRAAQLEAQASLALDHLHDLMQRTAQVYDPAIRINDRSELDAMPAELRTLVDVDLIGQLGSIPTFVERYVAGNDRGSMGNLVSASLRTNGDTQHWIAGERGWRENLLAAQIRKQGSTANVQTASSADWRASDQLQVRTLGVFGWGSWRRVGTRTSTARATQFDTNYRGVPAYYNVAGNPGEHFLRITAIATKRQSQVATTDVFGMHASEQPLAIAAMARVEFRRPSGGVFTALRPDRNEYANLFNPFWEAKLVPVEAGVAQ